MFDNLRHDTRRLRAIKTKPFPFYVLESLLFENGYQAVVTYRLASWFRRHGVPFLGPLFARWGLFLTGVDISPAAEIGPGLMVSHGVGIVVGGAARIGRDATLHQQVTIGAASVKRRGEMPVVGDGVTFGAGARAIGGLAIGDDVFVGAGVLLTEDVPSHSKVTAESRLVVERREPPAAS